MWSTASEPGLSRSELCQPFQIDSDAVLHMNLIHWIRFGSCEVRRLNRALLGSNHTTLLASMCRVLPFSARAPLALWIKNIFFDVDILAENKRNVVYRGLYSYRQRVGVITLFPNIFSFCFCLLSSDFAKVFERQVWPVQQQTTTATSTLFKEYLIIQKGLVRK